MLTRVAVFEGAIVAGGENALFDQVGERLEPIWRGFPHVLNGRLLRTREVDPGAIPVLIVLEMDFPGLGSIRASLVSDIKTEAHETTLEVLKPLSSWLFHSITENRSLDAGAS